MLKRLFDLSVALLMAVPALPIIIFFGFLIYVSDRGNPFFVQQRLGLNQRPFKLYKLRTMKMGTPSLATHEVSDQAVTRLGSFLRSSKIDELPQLWNIILGTMSFVGPRPCLPSQTTLTKERLKFNAFSVPPGITGLAQVNGVDMSDPAKLAIWDGEYVKRHSFLLDLKLLAQTARGMGFGDRIRPK